jgi:hypothetical protein
MRSMDVLANIGDIERDPYAGQVEAHQIDGAGETDNRSVVGAISVTSSRSRMITTAGRSSVATVGSHMLIW